MVSSTGQSLLSLIGWTVVPDFVTHQVLRTFYFIFGSKFQKQPPRPGSQAHRRHYAYAFSVVVLSYLTYNLIQSARYMPPNFYEILGVPPTVDDTGLKLAFRQFARLYHPDRPGVGRAGEELFMFIRDAYEALKNPTVRFAYDR
jgi:preprotein translocase subunit Sec63